MRDPNSLSLSLFDQLGAGMDIMGQVPVPKMHRYSEDADEGEIAPSEVPAGSMEEEDPMGSPNEETIDIAGLPHTRKHSYYSSGNSAVTEST